mmetsp:Transcript_18064/g.63927  ORF Transcript_18064/g.63927 Transcript_18064/m.63927 type:complete len:327 (+) Transcript_18064:443-1423(+)
MRTRRRRVRRRGDWHVVRAWRRCGAAHDAGGRAGSCVSRARAGASARAGVGRATRGRRWCWRRRRQRLRHARHRVLRRPRAPGARDGRAVAWPHSAADRQTRVGAAVAGDCRGRCRGARLRRGHHRGGRRCHVVHRRRARAAALPRAVRVAVRRRAGSVRRALGSAAVVAGHRGGRRPHDAAARVDARDTQLRDGPRQAAALGVPHGGPRARDLQRRRRACTAARGRRGGHAGQRRGRGGRRRRLAEALRRRRRRGARARPGGGVGGRRGGPRGPRRAGRARDFGGGGGGAAASDGDTGAAAQLAVASRRSGDACRHLQGRGARQA